MSGDNASSRDSAVIDDDLVEALGFEPTPLSSDDVDIETATNESGAVSVRTQPSDDDADRGNDAGDKSAESVAKHEDSAEIASSKRGVVILGDVTPVNAGDPVGGAIASAVLDELDEQDLPEATAASSAGSLFGERSASVDDSIELGESAEATDTAPTVAESTDAESTDAESADADQGKDGSAKADSSLDVSEERPVSPSLEVPLIESAFPDVPALDDAGKADSELDDRELFTQPVEIDNDLVQDLDVPLLERAVEEELEEQPVLEPQPAAVGVAPDRSGYRRKRVRARKTRRVIRHIDPWSVLTFSILFHLAMYTAFLLASVLVWKTLESSGMVENIEDFIIALGDYETYEINADVLFRAGVIIAGILTVASTILSVLLCVVFNLISDLVGGIRVTVLEEETVRLAPRKKRDKTK